MKSRITAGSAEIPSASSGQALQSREERALQDDKGGVRIMVTLRPNISGPLDSRGRLSLHR
jgi:hypothetical protein